MNAVAQELGMKDAETQHAHEVLLWLRNHGGEQAMEARRQYLDAVESDRQADALERRLSREQGW
jgi:hypothetical protein